MKSNLWLLVILSLSFIVIIPLFHPGLPVTDDGLAHVARIASFYQNLTEGNIIPRWAGNLNFGYGHPVLEFFYPMPSYLASLFHFIGFSFIDSTKLVFGLGMIGSGIFMYLWLREFLGDIPGIVGMFVYVYAPYRFYDLYGRGDIGENTAFAFMPLTLFFLYKYFQSKKGLFGICFSFTLALLILSHNILSLMFIPFVIFYSFYLTFTLSKNLQKQLILRTGMYAVLGFGLAAFFWIPAILESKYTYRDIVTAGTYGVRATVLSKMFFTPKDLVGLQNYSIIEIGLVQSLLLLTGVFQLLKKGEYSFLILGLLLYTAIALFFVSPQSAGIAEHILFLRNIQYPWRLFAIPVFCASVIGALLAKTMSQKHPLLVFSLCIIVIVVLNRNFWPLKGYVDKPDRYFTGAYNDSTNSSGESSPIWSKGVTAQVWMVQLTEKRSHEPIEVLNGYASIRQTKRTTTKHHYEVTVSEKAYLVENTLYFPGWNVFVDDKAVPIQFQNPNYPGLITFTLENGKHTVDLVYTETKVRLVADIFSLISLMSIGIIIISSRIKKGRSSRNLPI